MIQELPGWRWERSRSSGCSVTCSGWSRGWTWCPPTPCWDSGSPQLWGSRSRADGSHRNDLSKAGCWQLLRSVLINNQLLVTQSNHEQPRWREFQLLRKKWVWGHAHREGIGSEFSSWAPTSLANLSTCSSPRGSSSPAFDGTFGSKPEKFLWWTLKKNQKKTQEKKNLI